MSATRCGFIAIIGAPNAGKSTLTNYLTGAKISIVSPKAQTTRFRVRGVCMDGDAQMILIDTPGIFKAEERFDRSMVSAAWASLGDADAVILLVDAKKGWSEENIRIAEQLKKRVDKPLALAFNKIDLVPKEKLLALTAAASEHGTFEHIFMISAANGDGTKELKEWMHGHLPDGPWLFPEDHLSDQSMRRLAAEITREKLFLFLRQELPYSLTVDTELWEERKSGTVEIMQVIRVEREGHKKIVIGDKGEMLKKVGSSARRELEAQLERKVMLKLHVSVDPAWKDRPETLRMIEGRD